MAPTKRNNIITSAFAITSRSIPSGDNTTTCTSKTKRMPPSSPSPLRRQLQVQVPVVHSRTFPQIFRGLALFVLFLVLVLYILIGTEWVKRTDDLSIRNSSLKSTTPTTTTGKMMTTPPSTPIKKKRPKIATTPTDTSVSTLRGQDENSLVDNNNNFDDVTPSTPTRNSASDEAIALDKLSIVTMNIVGCQPSKEAPSNWNVPIVTDAIKGEILQYDPDILMLQEGPGGDGGVIWATRHFCMAGYQIIGATPSHAGYVILLVKNGISAKFVPTSNFNMYDDDLPVVMAELTGKQTKSYDTNNNGSNNTMDGKYYDNGRKLLVSSVHLAPYERGSFERQGQVEELLDKSKGIPLLIAGDTNMRDSEDDVMENSLGFNDVWKLAGSNESTEYTWDTRDHTVKKEETEQKEKKKKKQSKNDHNNDQDVVDDEEERKTTIVGSFNRYYGSNTRQYAARYDRVYVTKLETQQEHQKRYQQQQQKQMQKRDNKKQQQQQENQQPEYNSQQHPTTAAAATATATIDNIPTFQLIANHPISSTNPYHFLSDHFGIYTILELKWDGVF